MDRQSQNDPQSRRRNYLGVQLTPELYDRLVELSRYHGRSLAAETRIALGLLDACSMLNYLEQPEAAIELPDPDEREAAKRETSETLFSLIDAIKQPAPFNTPTLN